MDLVVQKATELGVARVLPFEAERSVVRLEAAKGEERGRALAPDRGGGVTPVRPRRRPGGAAARAALGRALGDLARDAQLRLPPRRRTARRGAAGAPRSPRWSGRRAGSPTTRCAPARRPAPRRASLGPRVLRAETAAIVAVALLQARFGDLR